MIEQFTPTRKLHAFRVGAWLVDPALDEIAREGETVRIEPRMMALLVRLADTPGQVVSSQDLLRTVWSGVIVGPASVYQAVSQLRKVLGDTESIPTYIATVPRKGYRLIAPVERDALQLSGDSTAIRREIRPARTRTRFAFSAWGVAIMLVAVAAAAALLASRAPERESGVTTLPIAASQTNTIAVLPLGAATQDEMSQALAAVAGDMLRTKLAKLSELIVVADGSTKQAVESEKGLAAIAEALHVRYLLHGDVAHIGDRMRLSVMLSDVSSTSPLWSRVFERPVTEIAAVQDEIVSHIAESLRVSHEAVVGGTKTQVNLDAYQLYLRGRQLMSTLRAADVKNASVMFSRVTTLDPSFARGYYSYGEALLLAADLGVWNMTDELAAQARDAFERATQLDPELGEAWAQRARLIEDPVEAEKLYRRAVQLSPGYDEIYVRYSDFLFSQRRRGEALELIDRARIINPLSAPLCWRKAQLLIATHGDVRAQQQQLLEALWLKPDFPSALRELAISKWVWVGEFADGIRLVERSMAIDRESDRGDWIAIGLYLAVDDPSAAKAVLRDTRRPDDTGARMQWIAITQLEGDTARAAELARNLTRELLQAESRTDFISKDHRAYSVAEELLGAYRHEANAIRDEAMITGDLPTALDLIGRTFQLRSGGNPMRNRGLVLTYAHTLMLAGQTRQAHDLLVSLLEHLDAEQIGRPPHWFSWERAAALAMLGQDERALEELTASVEMGRHVGWGYTAERDPVYSRIRNDPRFQALVAKTSAHRKQQRALLEEMRRKGEVPIRTWDGQMRPVPTGSSM